MQKLMAWGFGYFGQSYILERFIGIKEAGAILAMVGSVTIYVVKK